RIPLTWTYNALLVEVNPVHSDFGVMKMKSRSTCPTVEKSPCHYDRLRPPSKGLFSVSRGYFGLSSQRSRQLRIATPQMSVFPGNFATDAVSLRRYPHSLCHHGLLSSPAASCKATAIAHDESPHCLRGR